MLLSRFFYLSQMWLGWINVQQLSDHKHVWINFESVNSDKAPGPNEILLSGVWLHFSWCCCFTCNLCSFLLRVCVFLISAVLPVHQSQSVDILFLIISSASSADMKENLFSSKSRRKNGNYSWSKQMCSRFLTIYCMYKTSDCCSPVHQFKVQYSLIIIRRYHSEVMLSCKVKKNPLQDSDRI